MFKLNEKLVANIKDFLSGFCMNEQVAFAAGLTLQDSSGCSGSCFGCSGSCVGCSGNCGGCTGCQGSCQGGSK